MMIKCYMPMSIRNIFNLTNSRGISPMLDKLIIVSHDTANNDNNNKNENKKIIITIIFYYHY